MAAVRDAGRMDLRGDFRWKNMDFATRSSFHSLSTEGREPSGMAITDRDNEFVIWGLVNLQFTER
jgi:hypothetical protein